MAGRRGWGEDSIYFDHSGECRDPETHRHCLGRWRGVISLKPGPDGRRRRKKVSGRNKTEVRAKLAERHDGVVTDAGYTVEQAVRDWLADGLAGRAPKTVSTQREVLEPLVSIIGALPLRELSAAHVRAALKDLAATRATRTVAMTHAALMRAIRHAEANDKVRRNVAALVDPPAGQEGRPSKSLTFQEAVALIRAARGYGLSGYDHFDVRPNPRRPSRGARSACAVGLCIVRARRRPACADGCFAPCRTTCSASKLVTRTDQ
jgi:integrase